MIQEKLRNLIGDISKQEQSEELLKAKKEYQAISGEIFEDDQSYQSRMGAFLEWFVLDDLISHDFKTRLDQYMKTNSSLLSDDLQNLYENFSKWTHGIFVVKKIRPKEVDVYEVFDEKKYVVQYEQNHLGIKKDDIFETRLIYFKNSYFFTENFCFHPKETFSYIKNKVKSLNEQKKNFLKNIKQLKKDLIKCEKKRSSFLKKVNTLQTKQDKSSSEKKRVSLGEEISKLKNEINELEIQVNKYRKSIEEGECDQISKNKKNKFELLKRLSYMSLLCERSRQIDIKDIYKD